MKWFGSTAYTSALLLLFIISGRTFAGPSPGFIQSSDWSRTGDVARIMQEPLLVLFVSDDCNYCNRLKAEYLHPMLQKKQTHLVIREVNIDKGGKMTDFDGIPIRSRLFSGRYSIYATPTLVFLDSHGKELTSPIVGYSDPDNYQIHMEKALSDSRIVLDRISHQAAPF